MAQRHLYILSGEYQSLLPVLLTLKPRNIDIDTVGKNPKLLLEYKNPSPWSRIPSRLK